MSFTLNSELTYPQDGKSEFLVPEQLIWVSSVNSALMELRYYDLPWQPSNKKMVCVLRDTRIRNNYAYTYEHTFNRKSSTAAVAKERINIQTEFDSSVTI